MKNSRLLVLILFLLVNSELYANYDFVLGLQPKQALHRLPSNKYGNLGIIDGSIGGYLLLEETNKYRGPKRKLIFKIPYGSEDEAEKIREIALEYYRKLQGYSAQEKISDEMEKRGGNIQISVLLEGIGVENGERATLPNGTTVTFMKNDNSEGGGLEDSGNKKDEERSDENQNSDNSSAGDANPEVLKKELGEKFKIFFSQSMNDSVDEEEEEEEESGEVAKFDKETIASMLGKAKDVFLKNVIDSSEKQEKKGGLAYMIFDLHRLALSLGGMGKLAGIIKNEMRAFLVYSYGVDLRLQHSKNINKSELEERLKYKKELLREIFKSILPSAKLSDKDIEKLEISVPETDASIFIGDLFAHGFWLFGDEGNKLREESVKVVLGVIFNIFAKEMVDFLIEHSKKMIANKENAVVELANEMMRIKQYIEKENDCSVGDAKEDLGLLKKELENCKKNLKKFKEGGDTGECSKVLQDMKRMQEYIAKKELAENFNNLKILFSNHEEKIKVFSEEIAELKLFLSYLLGISQCSFAGLAQEFQPLLNKAIEDASEGRLKDELEKLKSFIEKVLGFIWGGTKEYGKRPCDKKK